MCCHSFLLPTFLFAAVEIGSFIGESKRATGFFGLFIQLEPALHAPSFYNRTRAQKRMRSTIRPTKIVCLPPFDRIIHVNFGIL
jgi:hypothetical protein